MYHDHKILTILPTTIINTMNDIQSFSSGHKTRLVNYVEDHKIYTAKYSMVTEEKNRTVTAILEMGDANADR